jgi:hypothetical protein
MNFIKMILDKIYNNKEILLASLGWLFALAELIIHQNIHRKDKKQDRKYTAYSTYMCKYDEIMKNIRNEDPNKLLEIFSEYFNQVLNNAGNEAIINDRVIKFIEQIQKFVISATEPLLILRQELHELKLICSDELLKRIEEMDKLIMDYNSSIQQKFAGTVSKNINSTVNALQTLTQDKRIYNFETLNNEILNIMRKEIGN